MNLASVLPSDGEIESHSHPDDTNKFDYRGRHAVVFEVPLFTEMKSENESRNRDIQSLRKIVEATNAKMSEGRFPKIVVGHSDEDQERPSVGFIQGPLYIRELPNGRSGIFGDLVIERGFFESQILTNRYPSRSIEEVVRGNDTTPDGVIAAIALLGSSLPQADVPDLVFHSADVETKPSYPSSRVARKENETMDLSQVMKAYNEASDDEKMKFRKMISASSEQQKNSEGEEKKEKTETQTNADATAQTSGAGVSPSTENMSAEIVTLRAQVGSLTKQIDRSQIQDRLGLLAREGVLLDVHSEADVILSLNSEEAREAAFERIEKNYKRVEGPAVVAATANFSSQYRPDKQVEVFSKESAIKIEKHAQDLLRKDPDLDGMKAFSKAAEELGIEIPGIQGNQERS